MPPLPHGSYATDDSADNFMTVHVAHGSFVCKDEQVATSAESKQSKCTMILPTALALHVAS